MNRRIRLLAFILAFATTLAIFQTSLVTGRDPSKRMKAFYREPADSLDVIFLGASHVLQGVNPFVIWQEAGVPSFVLAQPSQNISASWHYLNEMLKTQHPKAVFLETRYFIINNGKTGKMNDDSFLSIDAMRFSARKMQAAMDAYTTEGFIKFSLFPIVNYHTIWKTWVRQGTDLLQGDDPGIPLVEETGFTKGYRSSHIIYSFDPDILADAADAAKPAMQGPLSGDNLVFLEKIMALCRENNIKLVLFSIPFPDVEAKPADPLFEQSLDRIAMENGIERLELSRESSRIGLDWKQDLFDLDHLNVVGAMKFTRALASYIESHLGAFSLSDKRSDPEYASWNSDAELFFRLSNDMPMISDQEE